MPDSCLLGCIWRLYHRRTLSPPERFAPAHADACQSFTPSMDTWACRRGLSWGLRHKVQGLRFTVRASWFAILAILTHTHTLGRTSDSRSSRRHHPYPPTAPEPTDRRPPPRLLAAPRPKRERLRAASGPREAGPLCRFGFGFDFGFGYGLSSTSASHSGFWFWVLGRVPSVPRPGVHMDLYVLPFRPARSPAPQTLVPRAWPLPQGSRHLRPLPAVCCLLSAVCCPLPVLAWRSDPS
ncbi:hypothetical protein DENSPDRAFT_701059 [Dentipellis sp. KUC8613]|nr:hypothetical protein DENSPDRAFT_701059 [Dentipellis sp. KUC8613]